MENVKVYLRNYPFIAPLTRNSVLYLLNAESLIFLSPKSECIMRMRFMLVGGAVQKDDLFGSCCCELCISGATCLSGSYPNRFDR